MSPASSHNFYSSKISAIHHVISHHQFLRIHSFNGSDLCPKTVRERIRAESKEGALLSKLHLRITVCSDSWVLPYRTENLEEVYTLGHTGPGRFGTTLICTHLRVHVNPQGALRLRLEEDSDNAAPERYGQREAANLIKNVVVIPLFFVAKLKIIDFDSSVFYKPGEILCDVVGSPYYVAQEVLRKHYGPESDMWSAGVILYILLSGVPPFWAETEQEILLGRLDFHEPWPSISDSAKDLIQKMLDQNPKKA